MADQEIEISDKVFEEEIINSKKPTLLMFWGSWCPVCKQVEPMLRELKEEIEDKIKVRKINVDRNPKSASNYEISGTPTIFLFKHGQIEGTKVGAVTKKQLKAFIEKTLGVKLQ